MLKSFTWILIALTQCVPHLVVPGSAAEPIQLSYPIGTNCFEGVPKTNVTETESELAEIRELCDYIYEPEKRETSCYKLCLIDESYLINFKLAEDLNSNPNTFPQYYRTLSKYASYKLMHLHSGITGIYDKKTDSYIFGDEATDKAYGIISNQLEKCASFSWSHNWDVAHNDCWEMSPEARAVMDKLVDCFDNALVGNAKDYKFMTCTVVLLEAEKK